MAHTSGRKEVDQPKEEQFQLMHVVSFLMVMI